MAQDPYRYFRIEARELLQELGKAVMDLEKGTTTELVARMLRAAHTLKGAARVVRQREIADHAHLVEDALAPYRETTLAASRSVIDGLLGLLDSMSARVSALEAPANPEAALRERAPRDEAFRTVRAEVAEVDELLDGIAETHTHLAPLRQGVTEMARAKQVIQRLLNQRPSGADPGGASDVWEKRSRPVVEELAALVHTIERGFVLGIDQVDRELRQVRESAERLRLVPAGMLFTTMERTARDVAKQQGKRVAFEGRGADVRLDGHVLGAMQAALVQMVRNAVAHGIEPESERRALGKPAEGRVTLEVRRRGRGVIFSCADDGRGVDIEAVRRALERKGHAPAGLRELGSEDLLQLLVRGGITTSRDVTEMSGRGVGMDVVRQAVEGLGGQIAVRSDPGQGTVVEGVVPLSLAAVHALIVEASGAVVAIPLEAVREGLRIGTADVAHTPTGESVVHRGKLIPFTSLARALGIHLPSGAEQGRGSGARSAVIVADDRGVTAAVAVDRLLGTAAVFLRPLPDLAPASLVVVGAALDAEGNPQLVLDPNALVAEAARPWASNPGPEARRAPILVIDDSLTTRMLEQSILESSGYEVEVAASGEEALEKAAQKAYCLFLVDIEMPGIDGFTFIERTRRDPALRDIPAILVSSRAAPEDKRRGEEVGAAGYVVKSEFDQGALLGRIRRLLS